MKKQMIISVQQTKTSKKLITGYTSDKFLFFTYIFLIFFFKILAHLIFKKQFTSFK